MLAGVFLFLAQAIGIEFNFAYLIPIILVELYHEGLDKKCPGMLQGRHRLERGLRYYEYLGFFYGKDVYSTKFLALASGVGHHGGKMFQSDVGKYWIFFPE